MCSCTPTDGLFLIWQHRRIHWAGISHVRQATAVKVLLGPSHQEVGKAGWLVNNASWLKIEKKNLDWIVEYTVVLSVSVRQKMTEECCKSHLFNSICFWHFLVWPSKLAGSTEAEYKTIKRFTVSKDFFFQSCFPSTKFSVAVMGQKQYSRVLCLCFYYCKMYNCVIRILGESFLEHFVYAVWVCSTSFPHYICVCSPSWYPTEGPCGLAGLWQPLSRASRGGQMCLGLPTALTHTAAVCSQPSRTWQRHTDTLGEKEIEGEILQSRGVQNGWYIQG